MTGEKLKTILESLGYPAERIFLKANPPTYFTFEFISSEGQEYGDDDNESELHTIRVHLFSKTNYTRLLKDLKDVLKQAEFFSIKVDAEIYEKDTGYYHVPVNMQYLEVLK